jgi:hypothetical protein
MNGAHQNAAQAWACKSQKCKHVPLRLNASSQFIGALIAMLMGYMEPIASSMVLLRGALGEFFAVEANPMLIS